MLMHFKKFLFCESLLETMKPFSISEMVKSFFFSSQTKLCLEIKASDSAQMVLLQYLMMHLFLVSSETGSALHLCRYFFFIQTCIYIMFRFLQQFRKFGKCHDVINFIRSRSPSHSILDFVKK